MVLGCLALALMFLFSGCATTGEIPTSGVTSEKKAAYYKLQKGETLWRVAQANGVSIDDIIALNHIPNAALVEEGQLILIPGAESKKNISPEKIEADHGEFVWPLKGRMVEYFGERRGLVSNKGIGIAAREGARVLASRKGQVVFADYLSGYAYTVILDHSDGYFSVYSQNAKLLVSLGAQVSQGEPVAELGRKGILHFEIRRNSLAENPLHYLSKL